MFMIETEPQAEVRVSTIELFFDLVFVFTITQLTQTIVGIRNATEILQALLLLCTTWWMYGGYVWLTNNVDVRLRVSRLLLLLAMAGFLIMALAIPRAFQEGGLAYALAGLFVIVLHSIMFAFASRNAESARAIWNIFPFNFASGLFVLIGVLVGGIWTTWFWVLAVLTLIASTVFRRAQGFLLHPGHFAERHGLVVLIVLGESLIALGNGVSTQPISLFLFITAVLGLALTATLWWSYFDRDDTRAEHALAHMDKAERPSAALFGYGYAHLVLIAGIVAVAAGIKQVLAHLHEPPYPNAIWSLGLGLALYLVGNAWFRQAMRVGHRRLRLTVAGLALATIPLGFALGGFAQLLTQVTLMVVMLTLEHHARKKLQNHQISSSP
jgi:low temperature requirement protein LtrA